MNTYNFELFFNLNPGEDGWDFQDSLYEAGCSDAMISIGQKGVIEMTFNREAESAIDAILSAIENVLTAITHATLENIRPDIQNLTEMAFLFGTSKQNMRKYANNEVVKVSESFPAPVVIGKIAYWHTLDVALWLKNNTSIDVNLLLLETLTVIRSIKTNIDSFRYSIKKDAVISARVLELFQSNYIHHLPKAS